MRVGIVGAGYVGVVTAACLADSGNHVIAVDIDADKVARLNAGHAPLFEPGLEELLRSNLAALRLRFTTDLAEATRGAAVVFICVGTPPGADGAADLTGVFNVARQIIANLAGPTVAVVKSTVPVGTGARLEADLRGAAKHPFHIVSNPEFLKEGAAVEDFLRPDRIVIGADDPQAGELVAELHRPFVRNDKPILLMSRAAAEMTKYAANAYLATRISFINEIAALCETLGVDVDEVRRGIGADARIGRQYLYPGIGYGGSCFPKDVQALVSFAKDARVRPDLFAAVHRRNLEQREWLVARVKERFGGELRGRRFAVWGLAFKPKTDDVREAPAIAVIEALIAAGATVAAHDPRAIEPARRVLGDRVWFDSDAYAVLREADALLTCTEWMEYRSPDFDRIVAALKQPLIFDGRNIYDRRAMERRGIEYYSVGRPAFKHKRGS